MDVVKTSIEAKQYVEVKSEQERDLSYSRIAFDLAIIRTLMVSGEVFAIPYWGDPGESFVEPHEIRPYSRAKLLR